MRHLLSLLGLHLMLALPVSAQPSNPAEAARAALGDLQRAYEQMQTAGRAADRIRALTEAVRAYENGLDAVRTSLRRISVLEENLSASHAAQEQELARLIGMLMHVESAPPPIYLLHPQGPVGAARSAILLAEVTPALTARMETLRAQLGNLREVQQVQREVQTALRAGLAEAQEARTALAQAVADRRDLPVRFVDDADRLNRMAASAATLDAFARLLDDLPTTAPSTPSGATGSWPLPVSGVVIHGFNGTDAAGITRPGLVLGTEYSALVTSPSAATLRYVGPFLDLGQMVILEPAAGQMIVLSGLETVFGAPGQVIPAGAPIGLMGAAPSDQSHEIGTFLSTGSEGAGTVPPERLYIEVRDNGEPVDPETWFATGNDG